MPEGPVFLVGAQRSGTTALAHALARGFADAGGCFTVNGKLPYLLARWCTEADVEARHLRADEVVHALGRVAHAGGDPEWTVRVHATLVAAAERVAAGAAGTAADEVRRICAEAYGVRLWGDKYNEYLLDLAFLDRAFPDARWIFLARDPTMVVRSMLAWDGSKVWNPRESEAAAHKWAVWNRRWLSFRGEVAPDRRLELSYERLVAGDRGQLDAFAGAPVTHHLDAYQQRTPPAPGGFELPPDAIAVAGELAELGILRTQPAS